MTTEPPPSAPEPLNSGDDEARHAYTINQLVAYNFMRARRSSGWTQEECAAQLTLVTGKQWTNATVSAAERSWQTGRIKEFNANEIMAFCFIFQKPVASFLLPITTGAAPRHKYVMRKITEGDPVLQDDLKDMPQDPGKSWMMDLSVLDYVLPKERFVQGLSDEVNRLLRVHGLVWTPGSQAFNWRDESDDYWDSVGEAEENRLDLEDELVSRGPLFESDPIRKRLNLDPETLKAIIEEASEAAVLNFVRNIKRLDQQRDIDGLDTPKDGTGDDGSHGLGEPPF
ncbi:hypothetical protein [Streptomyces sp. H39-C1]|uniref:hypothetical protein n=1 Tax=Streptomyces sp. H39-C1 TaxID=3004355 RepID=UPI0022AFA790|nr:hypothetical protein [Streptomyces sp. H39-C1]MCZ4099875.1 hypothetical protein [Streptomyces sp. H39-C1]